MSRFTDAGLTAALTLLSLSPSLAAAQDFSAGDITIRSPWARATPTGAKVAGGYMTVMNHGSAPDCLIGGSLEAADGFQVHDMTTEDGIMKMRPTGPLTIPPGGTVTLGASGRHIMFTGLKRGLKKGDEVAGTLTFEHAGTVPVHFEVEAIGAKAPSDSGSSGHSMPGMTME